MDKDVESELIKFQGLDQASAIRSAEKLARTIPLMGLKEETKPVSGCSLITSDKMSGSFKTK